MTPAARTLRAGMVALYCLAGAQAAPGRAGDWPQFLGPQRNAVSAETGLNLDWKAKPPRTVWKAAVGGGFSSASIVGDRVVTQGQRGERQFVICLDAGDGKELWSYDAAPSYIDRQRQGAGPRSTPTVAGDRVYSLFPRGELVCLTLADGKPAWKINILEASGAKDRFQESFYWGLSASPLVEGDVVIVQPGGDKDNSVVAFSKTDGKMVWGVGADPSGYGSPVVIEVGGRRQVVCPTGQSVLGIDPAGGALLWRYSFPNFADIICATPVWTGDLLLVSAAYGAGSAAVEIVPDGDKWAVREKWANKNLQTLMATSVVRDGFAYGCNGDLGAWSLRCIDLKSGEVRWKERLPCRCSFVAADGCLFGLTEKGSLRLIEMNPDKYVLRGELPDLLAAKAWAIPSLADKRLYLRDESNMLCLDLGKD